MGQVGREDELAWLRAARSPLITITGPVGVGKTALAQRFVGTHEPGRVVRVFLGEAKDQDEAAALITRAHGLPQDTPGPRLADALRAVYQDQATEVLLLDAADHVLDAVARLVASLGDSVTVLVTSRTALGLSSEKVLRLAPLAHAAAVELLRAMSTRPASDSELAEVVHEVDALPVALQATSAWLDTLGPEELLRRLRNAEYPEHALRSAAGAVVQLEALFQDAFARLPAAAQEAYLRLSAWRGPFMPTEVEAMLQGLGASPIALIERLRASSWLLDGPRPGLLRHLRPVRTFAHARWSPAAQREVWAHLYLEALCAALAGATSALRAAELVREIDGAFSAIPPSATHRDALARLVALRWGEDFLSDRKFLDAGAARGLLELGDEAALDDRAHAALLCLAGRAERTDGRPGGPEAEAILTLERGQQAFARGQLAAASRCFESARGLAPPHTRARGLAAWGLARCLNLLGDDAAGDAYAAAVEALHAPVDRPLRVAAAASYAYYLLDRQALDAAMSSILALRQDALELGAELEEARTWIYEGNLERDRRDYVRARAAYDRAETLCRRAGSSEWLGVALMDRGILHLLHQEREAAARDLALARAELEPQAPTPCLPLTLAYQDLVTRLASQEASPAIRAKAAGDLEPDQPFAAALVVLSGAAAPPGATDSQHLRLARRAVALLAARSGDGLFVRRDGRGFRHRGAEQALGEGGPYAGLLRALAEARIQAPGRFVSAEALVEAGWPGERIQPSAAKNRLRVAMAKLRGLGLGELVESTVGGYRLSEGVDVSWWAHA